MLQMLYDKHCLTFTRMILFIPLLALGNRFWLFKTKKMSLGVLALLKSKYTKLLIIYFYDPFIILLSERASKFNA